MNIINHKSYIFLVSLLIAMCTPVYAELEEFFEVDTSTPQVDTLTEREVNQVIQLAESKKTEGQIDQTIAILNSLIDKYRSTLETKQKTLIYLNLSDAHFLLRDIDRANHFLNLGKDLGEKLKDPQISAQILNHSANIAMAHSNYVASLRAYDEALALLSKNKTDTHLTISVQLNRLRTFVADNQAFHAAEELPMLDAVIAQLPSSLQKSFYQVSVGHLAALLYPKVKDNYLALLGYDVLSKTLKDAESLENSRSQSRLKSSAYGYMGQLYQYSQKSDDAENLLQRAIFFANLAEAPELSSQWNAQLARLFQSQNKFASAQKHYWQAINALQSIRPAIVYGQRGNPKYFQNNVIDVYSDMIKVMLQLALEAESLLEKQKRLASVVDVLEQLNMVELEDYFLDDCVTKRQVKDNQGNRNKILTPGVAAIYPVLGEDHVFSLVSFPDGSIHYQSESVSKTDFQENIASFQQNLTRPGNPRRLRKNGLSLYNALIKPLESVLVDKDIHTLVIIPDGQLRGIPFAALYDGQGFLIERYAFATTPGLNLTIGKTSTKSQNILLSGLTKGVQGFNPLKYVDKEINKIAAFHAEDDVTILLNDNFNRAGIKSVLEQGALQTMSFNTHVEIRRNPRESFILTHDGQISLDDFDYLVRASQFGDDSIDLLVLSACDSAFGDERAALGLAGVAVKAGARSVLASLWPVNDASTADLIPEFFKVRSNTKMSKAQALQQAQIAVLNDPRFNHPFHWAPFVLIGHWL